MMLDALIPPFVSPNGAAQSMVIAGTTDLPMNNIVDLLGYGAGQAPSASIIGNPASGFWGQDSALGIWKLDVQINVGTAFVITAAGSAEFVMQGAPDTGAAGGYAPGTWYDLGTTGQHLAAALAANSVFRMAMPPTQPDDYTPRYLRMVMRHTNAVTAGTVTGAFMVAGRDDLPSAQRAASNYTVA